MSKFRIVKCTEAGCECDYAAWLILKSGLLVSESSRYDWALEWTLEQIKKQAAA